MNAVITNGQGEARLMDLPLPEPTEHQCLCRIEACATCTGTDIKIVAGKIGSKTQYPGILGHESVGTVVQCGKNARHIKCGDRFLRPAAAYPATQLDGYWGRMGGFAEYGLVTDVKAMLEDCPSAAVNAYCQYQQLIPPDIPITPVDATMLITLKEVGSYVRDIGVRFGSKVMVLGTGPVAMAMCFFAKLAGAYPVIVAGRRAEMIERCRTTGADFGVNSQSSDKVDRVREWTAGRGVDFIIDSTGDAELIEESGLLLVKNGALATYASVTAPRPLALEKISGIQRRKIIQTGPDETSMHQFMLDLTRLGCLPFGRFYSRVMPLNEFEKGFKMLADKTAFKIVFAME